MAEIFVDNLSLAYPLLGSGVRKKSLASRMSGAGRVARDKDNRSKGVLALKNVSLHLKDGDRLGIVGPNGAGKSTLLRVLAGIYEPSIGTVYVDGDIATLFNVGLGLQAEATGYRNILLSGLISGKSRKEIMARMPEIEAFSELGDYLNLPVRTYSNGMAMRLKFAAGTTFSPNILLMDEWLGAGDKKFTQKARQRMSEIVSSAGILVLASHRQRLIQNECNKILWLEGGIMKAFGAVDDVLPEFLKSMEPEPTTTTHIMPKFQSMPIKEPVIRTTPAQTGKQEDGVRPTRKKKAGGKKKAGAKKKASAKVKGAAKKKAGAKSKGAAKNRAVKKKAKIAAQATALSPNSRRKKRAGGKKKKAALKKAKQ